MRRSYPILLLLLVGLLAGCSQKALAPIHSAYHQPKKVIPKYEPLSQYGNPPYYRVDGVRYRILKSAKNYQQRGIASWYGPKFNGRLTSTRETFNMYELTAASPVLPLPCYVRVTNLENGRQLVVRVNDRGPFAKNRIIDLSYAAAKALGYSRKGTALVEVAAIDIKHPSNLKPTILPSHPQLYLQLGAFSHYQNATRFKTMLARYTQRPIRINKGELRQKPIYRVQIGPLLGVGQSDRLQTKLAKEGFGNAVTKIS
ncbi:MAG: septal ring lytic transglycosylase RlpA family protein [Gammaproteobacteria bacterium]|nr:septal ring lytic transglycosylase RlpA family protein [Gammaproteobacteria bacterium]